MAVVLSQPPASDEVDAASLSWRVLPEFGGGGRFVDMAVHTLDFLDFALGRIRQARGFAACLAGLYPAEDTVSATCEFESGVETN